MDESPAKLNTDKVAGWVVLPVLALLLMFAPMPDWVIEGLYAQDVYPGLQRLVTSATNFLPFAVMDVMLIAALLMVIFSSLRALQIASDRGLVEGLWGAARRLLRGSAALVIVFLVAWGYNYRRAPLERVLPGGKAAPPTIEALQAAVLDANALGAKLRRTLGPQTNVTYEEVAGQLEAPMGQALTQLQQPALGQPGRPKQSLLLTPFFTWAGVTGMINPIALACMRGTPSLAYSASLYLIMEAASGLPGENRQIAMKQLDAGVRADIDAILIRLQKGKPSVQRTASRVYDEYLRANRVADGTASYGRALSLILSAPIRDALSGYTVTDKEHKSGEAASSGGVKH